MPHPDAQPETFAFAIPEWLDEIDSTNDELKRRLAAGADIPSGTVTATRRQTRGRGRMGNGWVSSPERDLTFSFVWKGRATPEQAGTLPMACALGVRDCIASLDPEPTIFCKWPNDVLAGEGKICGILSETSTAAGDMRIITGLGINLRRDSRRDAAANRAIASIEAATGRTLQPEEALSLLLPFLALRIAAWRAHGFAGIRDDFTRHLWGLNRPMTARTANGPAAGLMRGVGDKGELLLQTREDTPPLRIASVAALEP